MEVEVMHPYHGAWRGYLRRRGREALIDVHIGLAPGALEHRMHDAVVVQRVERGLALPA
jgi:hypothetical protein